MIDRTCIGRAVPSHTVEVEKGRLRFIAKAIGETNPIYTDEAAARDAGYASLSVHPRSPSRSSRKSLTTEGISKRWALTFARCCMANRHLLITCQSALETRSRLKFISRTSSIKRTGSSRARGGCEKSNGCASPIFLKCPVQARKNAEPHNLIH